MNIVELQPIMLAIADVRPLSEVLQMITRALANQPRVLLARIWLKLPGDICHRCSLRDYCPDREQCLHLVASHARNGIPGQLKLEDLDGVFRRFPLGLRVIGKVGNTGESVWLRGFDDPRQWVARSGDRLGNDSFDPPSLSIFKDDVEGAGSFIGHPLVFKQETLGVLGVFCSESFEESDVVGLKTFADYAAVALNNAKTFEEIRSLHQRLELENSFLRSEVNKQGDGSEIVGTSLPFENVLERARLVASTDATVLLTGESGTGKSQLAKYIHSRSRRAKGNFVHVNCGSITPQLFESEFFGHIKGAFTGAVRDRIGRFQFADEGTLFLDEVAEIPLDLQSKLLKVVQTGIFERVGEDISRKVNVRIIAATNRNLSDAVKVGTFREDLYFRLSVFPVELPPLRNRMADIPLLAEYFLGQICRRLKRPVPEISPEQIAFLKQCEWKGNIRELENFIERAVIVSTGDTLVFEELTDRAELNPRPVDIPDRDELTFFTLAELKKFERENLCRLLKISKGRIYGKGGAAELFGAPPTTVISKLKTFGIKPGEES